MFALSGSVGDFFELVRSLDDLFQKSSFRESVDAAELSRVASHHRRDFSGAVAEIFDRVDFVRELVFFGRIGTFRSVDAAQIVEKSVHPFVDACFLSLVCFVVGLDESIQLSCASCDFFESPFSTRIFL